MKGVAARYPAFDKATGRPSISNSASIRAAPTSSRRRRCLSRAASCWRSRPSSREQSQGVPIETGGDPQLAPFIAKGRELYLQRQGQLNLGCANCHDDNWDKRLRGLARSRRDTRPVTRSTGWNGSRWDRCSGACAPASPASGAQAL